MRLVLQRVTSAKVTVDGKVVGEIGKGLVALCGIHENDAVASADWAAKKLCNTRLWEKDGKQWASSASSNNFGLLLVSQFTLFAALKGNKPDFHNAMGPDRAKPYWESFVKKVEAAHTGPVETGIFGAKMEVALVNDGPVTLVLDSPESAPPAPPPPPPAASRAPPPPTRAPPSPPPLPTAAPLDGLDWQYAMSDALRGTR